MINEIVSRETFGKSPREKVLSIDEHGLSAIQNERFTGEHFDVHRNEIDAEHVDH